MKQIDYVVWQEGKYYVVQCINVNISSFGETIDEAIANVKEAVELYLENEEELRKEFSEIKNIIIGRGTINV